ncbi:MAG: adenylate/guanylate cyclase domain-containing protein [Acidimicrobiia bacterium]
MADPKLRAHLMDLGASSAQMADLDDSSLIALAGDLHLAAGLGLSMGEVAAEAGCGADDLRAIYESLGLRVEELAGFGPGDVALASLITNDESGIVAEVRPELMRVTGTLVARLADAMVAAYVQDVEQPVDDETDLVAMANQNALASALALVFADQLPTVFRHHMWAAVRRQRNAQSGVRAPQIVHMAVGFVDLVGFTPLSRSLSPAELIATVEAFESRAFETAGRHGGRIIKSIGDEVMIAASDASVVAAIALELIETTGAAPSVAPRGGVSAGEVLFRHGDYYGPVVNLASRLTAEAIPGEVLTDQATIGSPLLSVQPAGRRTLKGFEEPVMVWSIDAAEPAPTRQTP